METKAHKHPQLNSSKFPAIAHRPIRSQYGLNKILWDEHRQELKDLLDGGDDGGEEEGEEEDDNNCLTRMMMSMLRRRNGQVMWE